ncbi:MAG: hypothetical protein ACKVOQ_22890 [Cyclobacteriaceae bacterium]|jgi:hypothetical protein
MKKISFLFIILCSSLTTWAQEPVATSEPVVLKSKRGITILPEAKEWALGISANPFLTYAGNFFHGNAFNGSPQFTYAENPTNNIAIFGKYMVDAHTAYRVRFNASVNSSADKRVVAQNEVTPDPLFPAFTQDWRKTSSQTIVVAAGYEKRRGSSRVQGVYGAEIILGYNGLSNKYEYGNSISQDFNAPTTADFIGNILIGTSNAATQRKVEENLGTSIYVGARGFIGVEYFIGPKISLGAEFGYSLAFRSTGKSVITAERWNTLTGSILQTKIDQDNGNYTSFLGTSLDNLNGSINLLFYF